jgi:chromosome segregation ATPase
LTQAYEAHAHTRAKLEEFEEVRLKAERQITHIKGLEDTIRQLMGDKETSRVELERLQNALKFCSTQRKDTERLVESTNMDVRDTRMANQELRAQVERLSREYERTNNSRNAEIFKEASEHEAKEYALVKRLQDLTSARLKDQTKSESESKRLHS